MPKLSSLHAAALTAVLLPFTASSAQAAHVSRHASFHAGHAHARGIVRSRSHGSSGNTETGSSTVGTNVLLGDTELETGRDSLDAGQARAFHFKATASGTPATVTVYIDAASTAKGMVVALYSSADGRPRALLASGADTAPKAGSWNSVAIGSTTVSAGQSYWVAILGEQGTLRYRDHRHADCTSDSSSTRDLTGAPSAWPSGPSARGCPLSAYVSAEDPLDPTPPAEPLPPVEEPSEPGSPAEPVETAPPAEAPSNRVLPAITGTPTQGQSLTASTGTWSGAPTSYAYEWQDCSSSGHTCTKITGASASEYTLTASDIGRRVRVVVTAGNGAGQSSARSATTAVVAASGTAPANTALPTIGGSAEEGKTLTANAGTWTGAPTSVHFQWETCNGSGSACSGTSTGQSLTLASTAVGHTIRVVVSASNSYGSASATSAPTAVVVADPPSGGESGGGESGSGESGSGETPPVVSGSNCMSAPGACGYPDPNYGNVGPGVACSTLTPTGGMTITTPGTKVEYKNITGQVGIDASNVTLSHDCITNNGNGDPGSRVVAVESGVTGTEISYSDIAGANTTSESVEEALTNNYNNPNTTADHDYVHNCGECVHGSWTLTNSYVIVNGTVPNCGSECPDHYEDIYCNDATFVAHHDVLLNPEGQTAALFCDTNGGYGGAAVNHITLTDSLIAGGDYTLYPQGGSTSVGSSTMDITGNRIARSGPGLLGYFPDGGVYGVAAYIYCPPVSGQVWSENVWDDTGTTVGC